MAGTGSVSMKGDELFSLPPAELACYAYAMANRQDFPYSLASPELGRPLRLAEIVFAGTKLAIERSRPKTTTDGRICPFQRYSISQNPARHSLQVGKVNRCRVNCHHFAELGCAASRATSPPLGETGERPASLLPR